MWVPPLAHVDIRDACATVDASIVVVAAAAAVAFESSAQAEMILVVFDFSVAFASAELQQVEVARKEHRLACLRRRTGGQE